MDESESAWPAKSYPCMFCQRGFTSAQALGGHMNVHRKDRAILRQSSSQVYHHAKNPSVPVNFSVPAGAHLTMRSTVGDEDQMASGYNFPISGDRRSKIIPFSQSVGSSRPSLGIQMKEYVFMTSSEDHGSCYRFQDPVGAEKQLQMEGTQSVDLELRLGQQTPD